MERRGYTLSSDRRRNPRGVELLKLLAVNRINMTGYAVKTLGPRANASKT